MTSRDDRLSPRSGFGSKLATVGPDMIGTRTISTVVDRGTSQTGSLPTSVCQTAKTVCTTKNPHPYLCGNTTSIDVTFCHQNCCRAIEKAHTTCTMDPKTMKVCRAVVLIRLASSSVFWVGRSISRVAPPLQVINHQAEDKNSVSSRRL